MAYNFPDSPNPGDVFQKWTWNGEAWVLTTPVNSAANVTFAPTGDIAATNVQAAIVEVDTEMHAADALLAPLASPVFTGDPRAPTPAAADNDTSIATTAFVKAAIPASYPYLPLTGGSMSGKIFSLGNTGLIQGAGASTALEIQGSSHAFMSFHIPGAFAFNFGGDSAGNLYIGGWSLGANAYKVWTTRDFGNIAAYLSNGRLPYAGDVVTPSTGFADLIAHALLSGVRSRWDYTNQYQTPDGFRCRYVQGYTTGWFTFAFA